MKRIAVVLGKLDQGGTEKALLTMLKMMDYSKYKITLFLEHDNGDLQKQLDPRVQVKTWEKKDTSNYMSFIKKLCKQHKWIPCLISLYYRALAHLFKRDNVRNERYSLRSNVFSKKQDEKFHAVVAYQGLDYKQLVYARNHIESDKYICWLHCNFEFMKKSDQKILANIYKWFNTIVCVSKSLRIHFLDFLPKYKKKTLVIYNLFDIRGIKEAAEQPIVEKMSGLVFATVGRVSHEKGQYMIPNVAKKLLALGYKFTWYVVGDGADIGLIRKDVEELSLEETIIITGAKENPYPYTKNCSLYIQPSHTEGFCLSTFEAKILGKHIVVTDVPGMREQFNEDEAVFCEPTVQSLVNGIIQAINMLDKPVKYKEETDEFNKTQLTRIDELLCS